MLLVALATAALIVADAAGATGADAEASLHAEVRIGTGGGEVDEADGTHGADGTGETADDGVDDGSGHGGDGTDHAMDDTGSDGKGEENGTTDNGTTRADATVQGDARVQARGAVQGDADIRAGGETTLSTCPTEVETRALDDGTVLVAFDASAGAETYQVLRAEADGPARVVATLDAASKTYVDADVEAGVTYTYQVQAVGGLSACPQIEVTTIPVFPSLAAGGLAVLGGGLGYALLGRR